MLEHSERPTSQGLTKEAKRSIGNFYLISQLINTPAREVDTWLFNEFNDHIGFEPITNIPNSLNERLGLQGFRWMRFSHRDSLSVLFVGKIINAKRFNNNYQDAIATIEIAKRKKFNEEINDWDDVPLFLRIAGVDKEQNRIIAATYDLEDNNRLTELNVSISHQESPICLDIGNAYGSMIRRRLSTSLDAVNSLHPYHAAGLVTDKMKMYDLPNRNELLIFHVYQNNVFPGKSLSEECLSDKEKLKAISEYLGYFTRKENGMITIGLKEVLRNTNNIKIAPWEISLPEALQKA